MRTLHISLFAIAAIAIASTSIPVLAQQTQSDTPPKLEKLEEGEAPAITIRQSEGKARITEKPSPDGKGTEVRVKSGKSSYVVKKNRQVGSALPGDAQSMTNRGAQWEVLEFSAGGAKKTKEVDDAPPPALAPATTPAAQPVSSKSK